MADELRCASADGVATVILNRPDKRNALNRALLDGLTACFAGLEDDPAVRVVVVRGAGPAFCAGMDLDELALHCDLRIAAEPARFAMPLARIGLVVPFTLGQKLVEIIGPAHTRHLLLTGRPLPARRAWEIGMVHEVVAPADLERATAELARTIAGNAPLALAGLKATIARAISAREGVEHADLDALAARARKSRDAKEGVFRGE